MQDTWSSICTTWVAIRDMVGSAPPNVWHVQQWSRCAVCLGQADHQGTSTSCSARHSSVMCVETCTTS
jgi:hypothetical protein